MSSPEIERFVYLVAARGGCRPDCLCEGSPVLCFTWFWEKTRGKLWVTHAQFLLQKSQIPDFPGGPGWRVCLPMQEMWVWSLVWEDSTCHEANKPVRHNYWVHALEPVSHNYWAPVLRLLKPRHPRAHALQQEKPSQWEACAPQTEEDPAQSKINNFFLNYKSHKKRILKAWCVWLVELPPHGRTHQE